MIALLLIPLVLPWALPPLARRTVARVRPESALLTITCATAALAVGVVASLGALLLPLALAVPGVSALAEPVRPLGAGPRLPVPAVSALAAGGLALAAVRGTRKAVAEAARLRVAHSRADGLPDAGGLCVLTDPRPEAFALPGGPRREGRIVVTTGMLRALEPAEREVLLAHERAHLAGRHHFFLCAAELSGRCHPALASVAKEVSFATERAADEAAARHCGDRAIVARAVGRAALAANRARAADTPAPALGVAAGPAPLPRQGPARPGTGTPRGSRAPRHGPGLRGGGGLVAGRCRMAARRHRSRAGRAAPRVTTARDEDSLS
ncbi:M48 family metalloprotease [Streptomyces sp. ITFR-16]|uniref:M48 family metalloprotease n=1 Tax=Streptomyces sp. ITFR-16 TaxID=3075198 RepID=UPI00288B1186|nr:M48 family metalloprotease [Streptomyces sp. ITFR-16]WNI20928.1 M48 family metalloprotease [Streptomyces sp. ITFR-16]